MRFIPTFIHGLMDYFMGVVLIALPWVLRFQGEPETWILVVLGAGVILYSLMTDYECGVVGLIPMTTHLTLDIFGGLILAASPWILGFADRVWIPHLVLGLMEVCAGLMTQTTPTRHPTHAGTRRVGT